MIQVRLPLSQANSLVTTVLMGMFQLPATFATRFSNMGCLGLKKWNPLAPQNLACAIEFRFNLGYLEDHPTNTGEYR